MSDITRDEFERLKARVAELEEQLESGSVDGDYDGFDARDKAVLDNLVESRGYTGLMIVNKYKAHTDITNTKTAKQRAKSLTKSDKFDQKGGEFIYVG